MNPDQLAAEAAHVAQQANVLAQHAQQLAGGTAPLAPIGYAVEPFMFLFTIFVIAVFVGYYVVWNVTPALHSPLMALTNAISSVIIVGAMLATGLSNSGVARAFGTVAVLLVSVNIFGGFLVTQRMLQMFRRKSAPPGTPPTLSASPLSRLRLPAFLSR
jgi:NAD(P) transhydrogenase subunit alpha